MEIIMYYIIIISLITLIFLLFNVYLVLIRKKQITFDMICNNIDRDVEFVFNKYVYIDMFRYALAINNTLGTDELKKYIGITFKEFKKVYPRKQYKKYNKLLNGTLDSLIMKIIYTKVTEVNLKLKIKVVKTEFN